ncbi:MAG: hypothetical protein OHK006_14850 [Thermodesulfovibrionales bacterium]
MGALHDRMKELLPDYVRGGISAGERQRVAEHLSGCEQCRQEAELLKDLFVLDVPDPGDGFWKALPVAVRSQARPSRPTSARWAAFAAFLRSLLSPAPVSAAVSLAVLVMVFSSVLQPPESEQLPRDPFVVSVIEYDDLSEADLPDERIALPDADGYSEEAGFGQATYHREFAALDDDELAALEEILMQKNNGGG